ncbi:retrovirus-related pol polyprotein from transposon TNT 1-94 [Tanacetum coccineum]|uniref:Retrovirus-related pol polyprotein from transposon TNT 1-94 n=1 Tax=Tanacetum coccineum TaxID=301880 RepID=A0ABQ5ACP0_9ASTR
MTSYTADPMGIIHRSNIDYTERIWEEFVQSIQTFLTDKKNLATASRGMKKTALLLIPNVRFTKLIIHYLRTKHNIHPRTGLPLHYSHDENVLNTLRYVGKDGREVFGMPIPDTFLTNEIKGAPYYSEYQEHIAKYQQIPDAKHDKAKEGGVTESSKTTKDDPLPAKRSKVSLVGKRRKAKSPLRLINEPSDEGVPVEEPTHADEDADLQRALELSLKEQWERTQGLAHPVVLREPGSGKFHPLPERRPPMPTESTGHVDSPSLDADLALTNSEMESDEEVPRINARDQDECQARPNPGEQDEG